MRAALTALVVGSLVTTCPASDGPEVRVVELSGKVDGICWSPDS